MTGDPRGRYFGKVLSQSLPLSTAAIAAAEADHALRLAQFRHAPREEREALNAAAIAARGELVRVQGLRDDEL